MEIKALQSKVQSLFQKYKYAFIIFLVGILFMIVPGNLLGSEDRGEVQEVVEQGSSVQQELEEILSYIKGAGTVRVMLKELSGEETIYEVNEDISVSDSSSDTKIDVITITDQNRNEHGLIKQVNPPKYQGAVILCQGGDDPSVKLAITDAVSKITGLGADKIAVLKMK